MGGWFPKNLQFRNLLVNIRKGKEGIIVFSNRGRPEGGPVSFLTSEDGGVKLYYRGGLIFLPS